MRLVTDIVQDGFKRHPKKWALAVKPRYRTLVWSYEELFQFAVGVEKFLGELGVNKGDRVVLWASNSPYWIGAFFGCLLRGAIVVPLHAENTPEFIQKVIDQTEPKILFKSSNFNPSGSDPDGLTLQPQRPCATLCRRDDFDTAEGLCRKMVKLDVPISHPAIRPLVVDRCYE